MLRGARYPLTIVVEPLKIGASPSPLERETAIDDVFFMVLS